MKTNNSDSPAALGKDTDESESGIERIQDPENYNHRRWLKQVHDAKSHVGQVLQQITNTRLTDPRSVDKYEDLIMADAVATYVSTLRPFLELQNMEDEFLSETVSIDRYEEITLGEIARTQGKPYDAEQAWDRAIPIEMSVRAWETCNSYLIKITGPQLDSSMPEQQGFDMT